MSWFCSARIALFRRSQRSSKPTALYVPSHRAHRSDCRLAWLPGQHDSMIGAPTAPVNSAATGSRESDRPARRYACPWSASSRDRPLPVPSLGPSEPGRRTVAAASDGRYVLFRPGDPPGWRMRESKATRWATVSASNAHGFQAVAPLSAQPVPAARTSADVEERWGPPNCGRRRHAGQGRVGGNLFLEPSCRLGSEGDHDVEATSKGQHPSSSDLHTLDPSARLRRGDPRLCRGRQYWDWTLWHTCYNLQYCGDCHLYKPWREEVAGRFRTVT
jgi:hypothetical protein